MAVSLPGAQQPVPRAVVVILGLAWLFIVVSGPRNLSDIFGPAPSSLWF